MKVTKMTAKQTLIYDIIKTSKHDAILSQAVARTAFSFVLLVTITMFHLYSGSAYSIAQKIVAVHLLYALFSIYLEYKHPKDSSVRKMTGIVADLGALSAVLAFSDLKMIFIYPVYLWVIVGNGMRYGMKYLYIALGFGTSMFAAAVFSNNAWSGHIELAVSMTIGVVVLGLFYGILINKIYKLNDELEHKVSERTEQLQFQLYHDDLTKLKNRYALKSSFHQEQNVELFLIDIDNFKDYNELYGMEIGNAILCKVAKSLEELARESGCEVYRIYGDGFAVKYVDDITPNTESCHLHIIAILSKLTSFHVDIGSGADRLEINFTVAAVYDKEHMLEKADMALRYARKKGMKYIVYDAKQDTKEEIGKNILWRERIKSAIAQDNILPVFQPIVNRNEKVIKYESLIRLKHDGKLISPFFFLDIAIKTRQYEKLTMIMINKSFTAMQKSDRNFSINLSFSDIHNVMTVKYLKSKIIKHNVGSRLIIEILETENADDFQRIQNFVEEMRELGVQIAIDDFGSGYSNFDHLFKLQPDYLKIDGSLIKVVDKDEDARKLVESIVFLAGKMQIKTIAEFVHSEEVYRVCRKLGIDEFQGYYFSEPQEEAKIISMENIAEAV